MREGIINIKKGVVDNRGEFVKLFKDLKDNRYLVSIKNIRRRSINQNAYYWGCVVAPIAERMRELGNEVDSEITHDFLKDRFNSKELFDQDGIVIGTARLSTATLTTIEFEEYLEKIKQFAAEYLGIVIVDPMKQSEIFKR